MSVAGHERRSNDVPGVSAQPQRPDPPAGQGGFRTGAIIDVSTMTVMRPPLLPSGSQAWAR